MLHAVAIFMIQENLKQTQNKTKNERDEKNSEDFDHALKKIGISFKAKQKKKYRLLCLIR